MIGLVYCGKGHPVGLLSLSGSASEVTRQASGTTTAKSPKSTVPKEPGSGHELPGAELTGMVSRIQWNYVGRRRHRSVRRKQWTITDRYVAMGVAEW